MLVKSSAVALMVAVGTTQAAVMYGKEAVVKADPDFGLCIPTMKFEGGLGGRPSMDFTFLPADPLCARGQPEASNPNIITNRICDQLSTVCGANAEAVLVCRDAQAKIRSLGTKDKSTADTWNTLMGFGYALTNPDGGAAVPGAVKEDLKKREASPKPLIPCSAFEWIDECTGWPAPVPVTKREEPAAPATVAKRDVPAEPIKEKSKRAGETFIACSAFEWIDECTGWP